MTDQLPYFNQAAFRTIKQAAGIIGFPQDLLGQDQRKHFDNLLLQFCSTPDRKFLPSQVSVIVEAARILEEELETSQSMTTHVESGTLKTRAQPSNTQGSDVALPGPGFDTPPTDDEMNAVFGQSTDLGVYDFSTTLGGMQDNTVDYQSAPVGNYPQANSSAPEQAYTNRVSSSTHNWLENQQDNLSTGIREPRNYVPSGLQSLNEPAKNNSKYTDPQDDNFDSNAVNPTPTYTNHSSQQLVQFVESAYNDILGQYNEFPHIDSNSSMDGMRQQSGQNVKPYLTLGARLDVEASFGATEIRYDEAPAPVQPEELGDVTKRGLQLIKRPKKGKGKVKSSSDTNRVVKQQSGPRKKAHTLKGSCWRCHDQKGRCERNPSDPDGDCNRCLKGHKINPYPCVVVEINGLIMYRGAKSSPHTSEPVRLALPELQLDARKPIPYSPIWNVKLCFSRESFSKSFRVEIKKFNLTDEEEVAEPNSLQAFYRTHPFCLSDTSKFSENIHDFASNITGHQTIELLRGCSNLCQQIFQKAFEITTQHPDDEVKNLVFRVLQFWVFARMNEGYWKLSHDSEICANTEITDMRYLDVQLAKTLKLNLAKQSQAVLRGVKVLFESKKPEDWMAKFVTTYILLHSWEVLMKQQHEIARERKLEQRFSNKGLLEDVHRSAITLLHAFYYKKHVRERFVIDWGKDGMHQIQGFPRADQEFLVSIANQLVATNAHECIREANEKQEWDQELSLTGMFFDHSVMPWRADQQQMIRTHWMAN